MRNAISIIDDTRHDAEHVRHQPDGLTLLYCEGRVFAVIDDYDAPDSITHEGRQIATYAGIGVRVGYTWAVYANQRDAVAGDYLEQNGGTSEHELIGALEKFRAYANLHPLP